MAACRAMGIAVGTGAAVITDIGIAISLATSMTVRAGATVVTDIGIDVTLAARRTMVVASRTGATGISLAASMAV